MNYEEALVFLNGFIDYEKKLPDKYSGAMYNPDKVGILLDEAGFGEKKRLLKIFHIAGTKGKGSVAFYISRLLEKTGAKTGLYTSPHALNVRERIKVNNEDISKKNFANILTKFGGLLKTNNSTYFEVLTFLATAYFINSGCEFAILETGLGGRLDSTNFCEPAISIITTISYDHTHILGNTIKDIANEKAGIIKPGVPALSAEQTDEAKEAISQTAMKNNSRFYYSNDMIDYEIIDRSRYGSVINANIKIDDITVNLSALRIHQLGDVFVENFLLSLSAVIIVNRKTLDFSMIEESASETINYRISLLKNNIIDVSHNGSSFEQLFKTVTGYLNENEIYLFIGILADKEIDRIAKVIERNKDLFQSVSIFDFKTNNSFRKSGGKKLFDLLKLDNKVYLKDISLVKPSISGLNVFTGSFYTVERILKLINKH